MGQPIGAGRGLLRELLRIVDGILFLGYLYAVLTDEHRRLGDYAARSYVVRRSFAGHPLVGVVTMMPAERLAA
jgi:uncharacterized RDD family membrane protein YckC